MLFQKHEDRYYYLASPYTHDNPDVRQWRYEQALAAGVQLAKDGIWTFGPIAHTHWMTVNHEMPVPHEFWDGWNRTMIKHSCGLIILTLEGWEESRGIQAEVQHAVEFRLPIDYMGWLHKCPI